MFVHDTGYKGRTQDQGPYDVLLNPSLCSLIWLSPPSQFLLLGLVVSSMSVSGARGLVPDGESQVFN